jgi:hypothetical protein
MSGTRRRFSQDAALFGAGLFWTEQEPASSGGEADDDAVARAAGKPGTSVHVRLHSVFRLTNPLFEIRLFDLERKKA